MNKFIIAAIALLAAGCAPREAMEQANAEQSKDNPSLVAHNRYMLGGYYVHEFISSEGAHCVIATGHLECAFQEKRL